MTTFKRNEGTREPESITNTSRKEEGTRTELSPHEEAREILHVLSQGRNPVTGEDLPADSCYQHTRVARAFQVALKALQKSEAGRGRQQPALAGQPWSQEEVRRLIQGFDQGLSYTQLAQNHQRTIGGIIARLEKLGKIPPSEKKAQQR